MRKPLLYFYSSIMFIISIFIHFNCSTDQPENKKLSQAEMVSRGKYLVDFGGCHDCHSPKKGFDENGPVFDTDRPLSGHPSNERLEDTDTSIIGSKWLQANHNLTAWGGPWGISFAANLTPDGPTGIGNWTEEIFIKAMRTGKHMGFGRPILPPMPWFSVGKLNDEDLKYLFAYLKSLKPVSNKVPDPIPMNMIAQSAK